MQPQYISIYLAFVWMVFHIEARTVQLSKSSVSQESERPVDVIKPPATLSNELDLAFIMDTTGSMTSYIDTARQNIREIVEEIVSSSNSDVRLALIEYRDHAPEDTTFVTRKNDFTNSVVTMKAWLTSARAQGGGDRPEAVADALFESTKLSWRPQAAKISVLISDAPPHGLVPSEDTSFPDGSPNGHDPMNIVRDLAQMGVTLYVIGCEPAIVPYKDFFMALAYLTGGQYVPLSVPRLLVKAITGGAQEELSLQKFEKVVQQEIQRASANGAAINEQQITSDLFKKLSQSGVKSKQLVLNNKALEGPSASAKQISESKSMADVRKIFKKASSAGTSFSGFRSSTGTLGGSARFLSKSMSGMIDTSRLSAADGVMGSVGGGTGVSDTIGTISTVESGITMEQINRLVKKGTAKLTSL